MSAAHHLTPGRQLPWYVCLSVGFRPSHLHMFDDPMQALQQPARPTTHGSLPMHTTRTSLPNLHRAALSMLGSNTLASICKGSTVHQPNHLISCTSVPFPSLYPIAGTVAAGASHDPRVAAWLAPLLNGMTALLVRPWSLPLAGAVAGAPDGPVAGASHDPRVAAWLRGAMARPPPAGLDTWLAAQLQLHLPADSYSGAAAGPGGGEGAVQQRQGAGEGQGDTVQLQALAAVVPHLPREVQDKVLELLVLAAEGCGDEGSGVRDVAEGQRRQRAAAALTLLCALHDAHGACGQGADGYGAEKSAHAALRHAMLAAAPPLLNSFWLTCLCGSGGWDEQLVRGGMRLVEVLLLLPSLSTASSKAQSSSASTITATTTGTNASGMDVLQTSVALWPLAAVSAALGAPAPEPPASLTVAAAAAAGETSVGAPEAAPGVGTVASLILDRQLGVLAAACAACRTLTAAAAATGSASGNDSGSPQDGAERCRGYREWACSVLRCLLELQPSDRLSEPEPGAGDGAGGAGWGGGGGGARRLELLPVFLELKWRLAVAALGLAAAAADDEASGGADAGEGGGGLPWELREALCEE